MSTRFHRLVVAALCVAAFSGQALAASGDAAPEGRVIGATPGKVPEPAGLWRGALHGYTPNTLAGATVLDTPGLARLLADQHPVPIDVADADKRPATLSATTLWMPAHRSIPGAVWLPGAGAGREDAGFAAAFAARIGALTGGDKDKPIVAFCHPDCWGSWNAAKRLVGLGYTHVSWYPEGMEGWQAGHDTAIVKADPAWSPPPLKDATQ